MADYMWSYREVIPDQSVPPTWKEISLNTGGTQSTLQDIKISERANGYCYRDATRHYTRNRFIYWRINNNILELVEQSLDVNLLSNRIKYKFIDTPILDGITVHETYASVVILVPTVCSVHRLIFPHPDQLHKQDDLLDSHPDLSLPSIFSESASSRNRDTSFYVYIGPSTSNSQLPHLAASWLTLDEEAMFLLSYPSGELLLVRQESNGEGHSIELVYDSLMPKFLTGMFRSKSSDANTIVSMLLHTIGLETYAITLCRDGQLRVWSCSRAQCIAVSDILSDFVNKKELVQGDQNHMLKKVVGADETDFIFGVYFCFVKKSHFEILRPVINGAQFAITKIYTVCSSPIGDLIDFSLTTNRIWAAFWEVNGEWNVYSAVFRHRYPSDERKNNWVPVILESVPSPEELPVDDTMDPRQQYLEYIFHPGRFPLQIISKALSIYKRSQVISEINLSAPILKQRVCLAIENEIQSELQENEVDDENYLKAAYWCWARFYSCCVQYHVAGLRPLGIFLLPSVSGAVVLKKSSYSFLRPLDVLEHLMLSTDHLSSESLYGHPQLSNTPKECNDLIVLANILVYIEEQTNEAAKMAFEREVSKSVLLNYDISNLLPEDNNDQFVETIEQNLINCSDRYAAVHKLLELLRMDQPLPENDEFPKELKTSVMHLFSSHLGVSVVNQCFVQQISIKLAICRNLLILQHICLNEDKDDQSFEAVRTVCLPEILVLIQSYYALFWLTQLTSSSVLPLESQNQRLSSLKLSPVFNLKPSTKQIYSLIELYAGSTGGYEAHKTLLNYDFTEDSLSHWHTSLLPYLTQLTLIIWPINGNASFTEWLLSSGQHYHLQQYTTLLVPWCDWNNLTRLFLLAVSFLSSGEFLKAYDIFVKATKGIYLEKFIIDRIGNVDKSKAIVLYFLKVIQLFELHGALDYAILAADTALAGVTTDDEPLRMTLYSIKFKHHLALKHYDDAFLALCTNPDDERKKDNLRDLVKTLLDAKRLDVLMSFDYTGMDQLFFSILFTRARASDAVKNIYYDFLYTYSIKKEFYRLSGSVMYEQAYRLKNNDTMDGLEKQVKCYLVAVNSLYLSNEKFRWVLRPADPDTIDQEYILPVRADSNEEPEVIRYKNEVDIIWIGDIEKELIYAKARLKLARLDPKTVSSSMTSPYELVVFLASSGIFKMAFTLCQAYNLSYEVVFEFVTQQCVKLTGHENNNAWDWLTENDLNDMIFIPKSPSSVAWALLQGYLNEYEEEHLTVYHKIISRKILVMGAYIPHWLLASYKERNPAELLRLYYFNGYLIEAYEIAMGYLHAALGHGPEYYGLNESLSPTCQPLCLPVNTIDALIYEFKLQNEKNPKKPLEQEYNSLKHLFIMYLESATRISYEICREKMTGKF